MREEGRETAKGPVFLGAKGNRLTQGRFWTAVHGPLVAELGLVGIRPYDTRHTCASLLLGAGVSLRVVADRLGHSDPAMTLRVYAHAMPAQQRDAARFWNSVIGECPTDATPADKDK